MRIFIGLTLCLSILSVTVNCDTFIQCDGVETETFVSSPNGCEFYIYCDNEDSFEGSCPGTMMFNSDDAVCDVAENVECRTETDSTTTIIASSTTTAVTATTPQITTWPAGTGTTPATVSPSTVGSSTVGPSTTTPLSTTTETDDVVCPQPSYPSEIIYLPSPTSCSEYYMCYRLVPMPMTCPDNSHYNSLTAQCDLPSNANCQIVGTTTPSPKELCTRQSSGYFTYPNNCHYYYRCTQGFLTIQECPLGFGWDANRKMCTTAECSNNNS